MRIESALLYVLLAAGAALAGCSSAERCTRGEEGCAGKLNVAASRMCDNGLTLEDGICVDNGGIRGDGGTSNGPVECSTESVEVACERFCQAFCRNEDLLCAQSRCDPDACEHDPDPDPESENVYEACYDNCSEDANPASCGNRLCVAEGKRTCEEFGFEDTKTGVFIAGCFEDDPVCVLNENGGCSDTCGTVNGVNGLLADNGVCEDGGEGSEGAQSSACARGTDCTDCGTRTCASPGSRCETHGDCCGFFGGDSFCVDVPDVGGVCLAICTETRTCPTGMTCRAIVSNEEYVCAPTDAE